MLKLLQKSKPNTVRVLLKDASSDLLNSLSECSLNVLKGRVVLTPKQKRSLCRHKSTLRILAKKGTSLAKKRKLLQKGGFLGALLGPVLSVVGSLVEGL